MSNNPNSLIIVAGDTNQLSDSLLVEQTGLQQIVKQPTRGAVAILDKIFVSVPCYEDVQVFLSTVRSDHKAILASSGGRQLFTGKEGRTAKFRKIVPRMIAAFVSHMKDFHFERNIDLPIQVEYDSFYALMLQMMDSFFPERTIRLTSKDPDYISPATKADLRLKNRLMRQGKVEQANALAVRIGHNIARRNAKDFSHMGSKTTSKELWDAVKKLKRRAVNKVPEPAGLDAEIFNKHYAQISTDLSYVEPG